MADDPSSGAFGFGKFVPGFDFLQNLAKGASQAVPQMPNLSSWVAPTLNVEELEKRISELRAVHFWLDQNSKALAATIQALEVQKMTLATLKGMNFSMGELAEALKLKPLEPLKQTPPPEAAKPARARPEPEPKVKAAKGNGSAGAAPVDPLQWWGALTQQFQEIAANAMKDVAAATESTRKEAKAAPAAKAAAKKAPARRPPARKSASA
ncbi:hypothetical protein HHL11_03490 [Ramlibacter sp. G-1-2-2]|uniref:Uncharacterized protein n=1 Tax=Ramlibacter agri TaxID=2728837 RepID=A0A848GZI4_9BURK|nr:PhaM family polyhydroxyalkanoate granule multifunctional regulatory protein [Ramlibacter agri]NML42801.1 hypothetical protein [Ramlibacter agri]